MVGVFIVEGVLVSIFIWTHHFIILSTDSCKLVFTPLDFKLESIWCKVKFMCEPRLFKSPILNSLISEIKGISVKLASPFAMSEFREVETVFLDPIKNLLPSW